MSAPAPAPFLLPAPLAALAAQLAGRWRMDPGDDPDVIIDEICQPSARGPFLETIVETRIQGRVQHRVRGGFAWNPKRRALVTWSKEGVQLRHFGYQTSSTDDGLGFDCRFPASGERDVLLLRLVDRTNLEIHRLGQRERVSLVRVEPP